MADLALVAPVLVALGGVPLIHNCLLQADLHLFEALADEGVRSHPCSSGLLELFRLALELSPHLLAEDREGLLVV